MLPKKRKLTHTMYLAQQKLKQNNQTKTKMFTLVSLLKRLENKHFLNDEQVNLLIGTKVTVKELYSRKESNTDLDSTAEYSPEFRKFAMTLHYYSSKGYNYLREVFNLSLPHPDIVEKWYNSINGKAGFTTESFNALKLIADKSKHPLYCCLIIGEMRIKKNIEWVGEDTYGHLEFGAGLDNCEAPEASEALVFLVSGINANWKVPVGYFLVDQTTGEQKANLVLQCLKNLHESKIIVSCLSFDGYVSYLVMARTLGCNLEPNEQMNTTFKHPITKQPVAIYLDPYHMMSLVTMTLQCNGNFEDGNGHKISWAYFELLNKLRERDIDFNNQKKIAQLHSKSVAKSLDFCREELKNQNFKGPPATVEFTRIFNDLIDILTSRNFKEFGFKQPLNLDNKTRIMEFFEKAENYITRLRDPQGGLLIKNVGFKTGFVGLLVCIRSTKLLIQMIEEERIKFLSLDRFSLHHLDLIYRNIRADSGCCDYPTCRQFDSFYKKMLRHVEMKNGNEGSFVQLEHISILNCCSAVQVINATISRVIFLDAEIDCRELNRRNNQDIDTFCRKLPQSTEFGKQSTIYYIAGYVVRALGKIIKCGKCNNVLSLPKSDIDHTFECVTFEDEGNLVYPSKDAVKICRVAESEIQQIINQTQNFRKKPSLTKPRLINKILRAFVNSNIFNSIAIHQFDQSPTENHLVHLIKAVATTYVDVRIHYLTKYGKPILTQRQLLINKLKSFQW